MTTFQISSNILIIHESCFEHNSLGQKKIYYKLFTFRISYQFINRSAAKYEWVSSHAIPSYNTSKKIHPESSCWTIQQTGTQSRLHLFGENLKVSWDKFLPSYIFTHLTVDLTRIQVALRLILVFFVERLGIPRKYSTVVLKKNVIINCMLKIVLFSSPLVC